MIELFDSHAHLNDEAYKEDLEQVIKKCFDNNVKYITNIGTGIKSSKEAIEIANKYENIYATVGVHPDEYEDGYDILILEDLAKNKKVVAIGEAGLEYRTSNLCRQKQQEIFIEQINLANKLKLPVIIHNRDADMDMLEILKENKPQNGFVMHCFSSSIEIAKEVLKMGAYISFSGTVTFKNAKSLPEIVKIVPKDRLLIETDSPYLTPEPFRGMRNDPSLIINTAKKIAEIKEETLEEIATITTRNAKKFYKIGG